MEGINDIGTARQNPTPRAADLIAGHRQLIEQAHARGLKICGATLTPFWGAAYYTEVREGSARRSTSGSGATRLTTASSTSTKRRDPSDPKKFLAAYDSCDYLHPSDAGYKAMADAIDLALFRTGPASRTSSSSSR
jgi:lysophospholipase L1-like esterase